MGIKKLLAVDSSQYSAGAINEVAKCSRPASQPESKHWIDPPDLFVLDSLVYTGIKRLFFGSVAMSVVGHVPCSMEVLQRKQSPEVAQKIQ
jgi:hypothetical protein